MKWTPEKQKLDDAIAQDIMQNNKFDVLHYFFPETKDMVAYSNAVYPYPYRRNSVLALLVQAENLDLFHHFFDTYFSNHSDNECFEKSFLFGTNQIGQVMNYHYFRKNLSDDILKQEADFLGVPFSSDNSFFKSSQKSDIYYFLKSRWKKFHDNLIFNQNELIQNNGELSEKVFLNETSLWKHACSPWRDIALQTDDNFVEQAQVSLMSDTSFCEQVFKQLNFPDDFFWAADMLRQFEKQARNMSSQMKEKTLFFNENNGIVLFNQQQDNTKTNLQDNNAAAYLAYGNPQGLVLGLNRKNLTNSHNYDEILQHELTHAVDLRQNSYQDTAFSDSDFMKLVDMACYVNRLPIVKSVVTRYQHEARRCELLACIMENDKLDMPIFEAVHKMFHRYTELRLGKDYSALEENEKKVQRSFDNYNTWLALYDAFDNFTEVDNYYNNYNSYIFDFDSQAAKIGQNFYRKAFRYFGTKNDFRQTLLKKVCDVSEKVLNPSDTRNENLLLSLYYSFTRRS